MKNVQRADCGDYLMDVENKSGVDKVPITLKVIGSVTDYVLQIIITI